MKIRKLGKLVFKYATSIQTMSTYLITMKRSLRRKQLASKKKIQIRKGNFVSFIALWRRKLGIDLGVNKRGMHWLAIISIQSFIVATSLQGIAFFQAKEASKIFECFSMISFCGIGFLKLYSLKERQERWYALFSRASYLEIQQLNSEDPTNADYESEDEENDIIQQQITKYTQKFTSMSKLLFRIYAVTVVMYVSLPLIEYAICKIRGYEVLEYSHILPVWTALDKISFLVYVVTILVEAIACIYCVSIHAIFDLSTVGMMIFIHGQFLLLRQSCERIGGGGRICNLSKKRDLRAHFRIVRCQQIRASLIKSANELSGLTKNILGIYFNIVTLILCSVAVQVLSDELSRTQVFTLLQYMGASLVQLFFFCYYGNDVIYESSLSLGEGPSASAWWCLSPRIRREVAFLCLSMTRRCQLLAGPFHFVNLPAFIQIIRTAYSYYAVIRQNPANK